MATLIVRKGASPLMGQKQVTNYVYVPSGDEIQTIDNVYTETEIPSGRLEMYVPGMHSSNSVFNTPCWYNDKEQTISGNPVYVTIEIKTDMSGGTTPITKLDRLSAYYSIDGTSAGFLEPVKLPEAYFPPLPEGHEDAEHVAYPVKVKYSGAKATDRGEDRSVMIRDENGDIDYPPRYYTTSALKFPITNVTWEYRCFYAISYIDPDTGKTEKYWVEMDGGSYTATHYSETMHMPVPVTGALKYIRRMYECELTMQEVET